MFVINKADLVNPAKTIYNIASGLQERDGWRPPVQKTIAVKGTGIPAVVDSLEKFRKHLEAEGLREKRLRKRIESELVDAAFSDFHDQTVERLRDQKELDALVGSGLWDTSQEVLREKRCSIQMVKVTGKTGPIPVYAGHLRWNVSGPAVDHAPVHRVWFGSRN